MAGHIGEDFGRYDYMDRANFLLNARESMNEMKTTSLLQASLASPLMVFSTGAPADRNPGCEIE